MAEPYEIYAVRHARHERGRSENFIGGDSYDGLMPLYDFAWAIIGNGHHFVVNTGGDAPARSGLTDVVRLDAESIGRQMKSQQERRPHGL